MWNDAERAQALGRERATLDRTVTGIRELTEGLASAGELLDLPYVGRLLEEHKRGEVDHSRKVWTVLVFCVWHAIFVERSLDPGISRNQSALLTKPVVGSMVS